MTASAAEKLDKGASTHYQKRHVRPYLEYRDTGIKALGSIPATWEIKRAKYLFREVNERSSDGLETLLSVSEYYGVKPRSETIDENEHISRADSLEGYKKCQKDDLVMNIMLAWKCGHGVTEYEGIVSPAYSVFRLDKRQVLPKYIHYLSRTPQYTGYFKTLSTGIIDSRLRLYPDKFGMIFFVLPPLSTQQSIADFLDRETARIDNLIAEKQNFIDLLKEKRQALISHVVTKGLDPKAKMKDSGIEWIGEVPERWMKTRLKFHVANIIDTEHKTIPFVDESTYLVVRTSDIREGELLRAQCRRTDPDSFEEWTRRGVPSAGDVILTREAPAGEACIVPDGLNVCLGQRTVLIRTGQSLLSEYLVLVIYSDLTKTFIDNASMGSTVKHLNMADIPNIPLFLPDLETQAAIVEFTKRELGKINQIRTETLSSIELLNEHRTALISAAVTGKIDVREQQ